MADAIDRCSREVMGLRENQTETREVPVWRLGSFATVHRNCAGLNIWSIADFSNGMLFGCMVFSCIEDAAGAMADMTDAGIQPSAYPSDDEKKAIREITAVRNGLVLLEEAKHMLPGGNPLEGRDARIAFLERCRRTPGSISV